jgi:uncharacterized membrane-anchored protein YhcB (DUF1043 family)
MKKKCDKKLIITVVIGIFVVAGIVIGIVFFDLGIRKVADPISEQCKFACESEQTYSFCSVKREVNKKLKATCKELSENSQYSEYGVAKCPVIDC